MTHDRQDSFLAWITGSVAQVIGMITFEGILMPLLLAFGGGFLGYMGKELGSRAIKKIFKKSEQN